MTGLVNDCSKSTKKEPIPKPIAPIQKPLFHLATLTSWSPSKTIQMNSPSGSSKRISYGVLNLAMRNGLDNPKPVVPGEVMNVSIKLDDTGYEIPAGHKLRLAVSTAYFPLIWPAPKNAKLTLDLASSYLTILPSISNDDIIDSPLI